MKNTKCKVNVSKDTVQNTYTFEFKTLKDIKIIDARLLLKTSDNFSDVKVYNHVEGNENDPWLIDLIKTIKSGEETTINISDELQFAIDSGKNSLKLSFEPTLNTSDITIVDSSCSIELEYISMSEYKSNGSTHSVNVGKAGTATVDLATGKMSEQTPLFSTDKNALPVSVCANYNSVKNELLPDVGLPNNWSLNLNQFLIKEETDDGSLKFSYIDENGKNQIIEEKYYYLDENEKRVYISRTKLSVDLDGKLIFEEISENNTITHSIETSLEAPSGLKLSASIEGLNGYELVNYEPDELASVKEQINQIDSQLEEIDINKKRNDEQLFLLLFSQQILNEQKSLKKDSLKENNFYLDLKKKIEKIRMVVGQKNRSFKNLDTTAENPSTRDYAVSYLKNKNFDYKKISEIFDYYYNNKSFPVGDGTEHIMQDGDVRVVAQILANESNDIYSLGIVNPQDIGDYEPINEYPDINEKNGKSINEFKGSIDMENRNLNYENSINEEIDEKEFKNLVESTIKSVIVQSEKISSKTDGTVSQVVSENDETSNKMTNKYIEELKSKYIINIGDTLDRLKKFNNALTYTLKDALSIDLQIESIILTNFKYQKKEADLLQTKMRLIHQQELYELQVPTHYLYNDQNIIYGFGKTIDKNRFRLILIADSYKNTIFISYDSLESNKIENITDSSEKSIAFEYDKNNIVITDQNDSKYTLSYDENNNLRTIKCNDKIFAYYYYDENNHLQYIFNQSGLGSKFSYSNKKVSRIDSVSGLEKIENKEESFKPTFNFENTNFDDCLLSDSYITFDYSNYKSTTLTDAKGKSNTYLFDKYGNVRTVYENKFTDDSDDICVKANEFSYKNNKVVSKVTTLPYSENYLSDACFDKKSIETVEALYLSNSTLCGNDMIPYCYTKCAKYHTIPTSENAESVSMKMSDTNIKSINNALSCDHKMLIVSGWAKADSAFIITDEDKEQYPDYIQKRKFEIRTNVTYKDESSDEFSRPFDWRNTEWQYCAMPLPLRNKEVIKMEFTIDYTGNTGDMKYTDFEIKEADWETIEYDGDLPVRKDSAHSKWSVIYAYDKDNKLIKETIFEKKDNKEDETASIKKGLSTTYEYTKQGKLLRTTNYNGIVKENIYNDNGIIIKTITYNEDEPSNKLYEERLVDEKGNPTGEINEFSKEITKYENLDNLGNVKTQVESSGVKTSFGYDKDNTLLESTTTIDGISNTNTFGYTLDFNTSLKHNNFEIGYDYDSRGRLTKINIANSEYLSKTYGEDEETTILSSHGEYRQTFNENNDVLETYYKKEKDSSEELISQNIYDVYGNLVFAKDLISNTTHKVSYDKFGNIYKEENNQHGKQLTVENLFDDSHKNITNATITIDGNKLNYIYEYDKNKPDTNLTKITLSDQNDSKILTQKISYDKLGRVAKTSTNNISKEFTYLKVGDHTSTLVSKLQYATNNINKNSLRYLYDEKGNITEVRENNSLVTRYKYDGLSRIVREDNKILEKTTAFAYDAGGNITDRIEYPFTLVDNLDVLDGIPVTYSYSSTGWRDQLMEFKGEKFEYDAIGNPTTYRGDTLKWSHGRQLDKYSKINKDNDEEIPTASYTYNANGIRTSKTYYTDASCQCKSETNTCTCEGSNCFTTKYFLNGNKIIKQYDCCNDLTFYYGADGLTGFHIKSANAKYKDENLDHDFFYKKNLQGDIIGIFDSNGEELVKYVYDAWGNHTAYNAKTNKPLDISSYESYTNTSNIEQFIANKNPFRYRGYYYDFETSLYYLNSRYYDPEIGRFVNADDVSNLSPMEMNGLNLYAYGINNPVNLSDQCGHAWWHWLVGALVLIGAAIAVVATAGGALAGMAAVAAVAAGGTAATMGATVAAAVFIGAVTSFTAMAVVAGIDSIGTLSNDGSFGDALNTFAGYGESAMWSTLTGGILGGLAGYYQYKSLNTFSGTHTPGKSTPFSTYKNTKDQTITHYDKYGNMWWSKHLTNHNFQNHSAPHWHLEMPHRGPFNNLFKFIIEFLKNLRK